VNDERDQDWQDKVDKTAAEVHQLWTVLFDTGGDYGAQDPILVVLRHSDPYPQAAALERIRAYAADAQWWDGQDADNVVYCVAIWEGDVTHGLTSSATVIRT